MTGIHQMLLGGAGLGGGTVGFNINALDDTRASPTISTIAVNFDPSGTITYTGQASTGSPTWITPNVGTPGNFYFIRLTVNSGDAPGGGDAVNTVLALTAQRVWNLTANAGQFKSGNWTVSIYSDAAGANLVFSDSFPIHCEST